MNFFGFHFCHEELAMLLAGLPFLGLAGQWFRSKWHWVTGKKPACKNTEHTCHPHDED